MASRVEGDFSGTSHTLRINTTELEDQQDYFCSVTDVNNATTVNSTTLNVLCKFLHHLFHQPVHIYVRKMHNGP